MRIFFVTVAMIAATFGHPARGDECDDATNQQAINLCAYEAWNAADVELNTAYQRAMDFMKSIDADLPEAEQGAATALRDAQRAWVTFRDKACEAEGFVMQGGSAQPMLISGCMRVLSEERTRSLSELAGQY